LDFASEPPLPRDEILALLAADVAPGQDAEFRRYAGGAGGITPQEQLFREQAARQIAGVATAELNRAVRQAIGVDFSVTPTITSANQAANTLDPGLRFMIGKQAGRVYITYSRSTSSTRDQIIQIEINQTDRLSWILTRNEEGRYSLDVQVRRTF
jgi:hypothetical protein